MTGLEGKVAIVTGAARMRGIGRAIVVRLAREGADVVVSGVRRARESFPDEERRAGWRGLASLCEEVEALGRHAGVGGGRCRGRAQRNRKSPGGCDRRDW